MTTLLTSDEPILISFFFLPHLMNLAFPHPWIMQFHSDAKCFQMAAGGLLIQGKMELVILVAFPRLFLISLIP